MVFESEFDFSRDGGLSYIKNAVVMDKSVLIVGLGGTGCKALKEVKKSIL